MKARVKATGEIVEVERTILRGVEYYIKTTGEKIGYLYMECELDFNLDCDYIPDYWTRLEHQYAGIIAQGIVANSDLFQRMIIKAEETQDVYNNVAEKAIAIAHSLVEKYKKEENNGKKCTF